MSGYWVKIAQGFNLSTGGDRGHRPGKTASDRASGATDRNRANKAERAAWCNENRGKGSKRSPFPFHTCNGKRSRALRKAGGA